MVKTDWEVLQFLHDRLVHVHGEHELFDYMHRLRGIIRMLKDREKLHERIEDTNRMVERWNKRIEDATKPSAGVPSK